MNYELAKQLKDAGFPFKVYSKYGSNPDKIVGEFITFDGADYWILPTLSELIEACIKSGGYTGFGLGWNRENGVWTARLESLADKPVAVGSTPEEAVARLSLALKNL